MNLLTRSQKAYVHAWKITTEILACVEPSQISALLAWFALTGFYKVLIAHYDTWQLLGLKAPTYLDGLKTHRKK